MQSTHSFSYNNYVVTLTTIDKNKIFKIYDKNKCTHTGVLTEVDVMTDHKITVFANFYIDTEERFLGLSALGLLFILSVGFGEEVFNRGFVYGFLERHGQYFGLIWSSVIFGLLHLNRYLGSNWDGWQAYSHVLSASAIGLFMCALMMVTKSIWTSIIFHALANWHLAFKGRRDSDVEVVGQSLLQNLFDPFWSVLFYSTFAFFILWMNSGMVLSSRVTTLLTRFKLVDQELKV
jgi:hypothetical protein